MSASTRRIANQIGRIEDGPLLTGNGRFIDDVGFPGLLHAAFVRSPHAHSRITGCDRASARNCDGVEGVFTAADFAPHLKISRIATALPSPAYRPQANRPVLAED